MQIDVDPARRFGGIDRLYGTGSIDALRAAHACTLAGGADPMIAVKLPVALATFWTLRGYAAEGRKAIRAALGLPAIQASDLARAHALYTEAALASDGQGDHVAAREMLEHGRPLREKGRLWIPFGVGGIANGCMVIAGRRALSELPRLLDDALRVPLPAVPPQVARIVTTGIGGSEAPARMLAARLADAGLAARFCATSQFLANPPRGDLLVVLT